MVAPLIPASEIPTIERLERHTERVLANYALLNPVVGGTLPLSVRLVNLIAALELAKDRAEELGW